MLRVIAASLSLLFLNGLVVQAADPDVTVKVGADGLTFTPSTATASNGTVVHFVFSGTHSVTQSTFAAPCTHNGFNSAPQSSGATFSLTITDDSHPIWFYCNVGTHCGAGMVGAINAPSTGNTFDAYHAAAVAIGPTEAQQTDASTVVSQGNGATVVTTTAAGGTATSAAPHASSTMSAASQQLSFSAGSALVGGALALLAAAA